MQLDQNFIKDVMARAIWMEKTFGTHNTFVEYTNDESVVLCGLVATWQGGREILAFEIGIGDWLAIIDQHITPMDLAAAAETGCLLTYNNGCLSVDTVQNVGEYLRLKSCFLRYPYKDEFRIIDPSRQNIDVLYNYDWPLIFVHQEDDGHKRLFYARLEPQEQKLTYVGCDITDTQIDEMKANRIDVIDPFLSSKKLYEMGWLGNSEFVFHTVPPDSYPHLPTPGVKLNPEKDLEPAP